MPLTTAALQTPICAIGASAGGVAALQKLFSAIDDNLGLAYVVVIHLAPDKPSQLGEILAGRTRMPVEQVERTAQLKPNHVYVIPPDRELVITHDDLLARPFSEPRGKRAPIDMFFRSVAAARGDGIAIILSGAGSDGAMGVRSIKEGGGVVFVQDPGDAEYPMMPRSALATGVVDFVGPIDRMPTTLAEVVRSKAALMALREEDAEADLRQIVGFLRHRTGHDFSSYKRSTLMRRVARRIQVNRQDGLASYGEYLRSTPEEAQELFSDLLISVTQFFRDPRAFQLLADIAISKLADALTDDEGVRVWVVGCATGEEAYSVAILLLEEADRRGIVDPRIQLFASDLDEGALATAREARYPRAIEADVSDERLQRFFVDEGPYYRVRKEVRDRVLFACHSAVRDPPFIRLDLITCRNLLIYLERDLQRQLCALFQYALKPGGILFLGSAETTDTLPELFTVVDRDARIYAARVTAGQGTPVLPRLLRDNKPQSREAAHPILAEGGYLGASHASALEQRAPPSVLVDEMQRVLHISPRASRYFLPSEGPFSADLTGLVRPELRLDLKLALERAMIHREVTLTIPVVLGVDGQLRRTAMQITPLSDGNTPDAKTAARAVVFFLDGGPFEGVAMGVVDGDIAPVDAKRLREELGAAQTKLGESRREHEHAMQDLRVANEELQSINEEYRSTAEELETSKEELQSMNEELQTVNGELKSKLIAISSAHDDLLNLMAATEIGTLFLDPELRIKLFTPTVASHFNITEPDIGRSIADFTHRLVYDNVEKDAREVLDKLVPKEIEVATRSGHWLMMRMRPYRTVENRIDGVVLTFFDVTSRRLAEGELKSSEARYRQLFNSIDEGFSVFEMLFDGEDRPVDYRYIEINPAFERHLELSNVVGRTMRSMMPDHEQVWYDTFGRISKTGQSERFEAAAAKLGKHFDVFAFCVGDPADRKIAAIMRDVSERREHIRHVELLMREVNHRSKNMLSLVQAIARQTTTRHPKDFLSTFDERIQALAAAQDLLVKSDWRGVELSELIRIQCAIFKGLIGRRIAIEGEPMTITPPAAQAMAMAIHELCTNAGKYGALSNAEGRVTVTWAIHGDQFQISWLERGGPPVSKPNKAGFGTSILCRVIESQLSGKVELNYAIEGVDWRLRCPLAQVMASRWEAAELQRV